MAHSDGSASCGKPTQVSASIWLTERGFPLSKLLAPAPVGYGFGIRLAYFLGLFAVGRRIARYSFDHLYPRLYGFREVQLNPQRTVVLKKLLQGIAKPGLRILEIGSWMGCGSTSLFARCVKEQGGVLYCVDTWGGRGGSLSPVNSLEWRGELFDIFSMFQERMRMVGTRDVVHPLVMSSDAALAVLKDEWFDLIFIDGDHTYPQVKKDIVASFGKLKTGGIFCGDDCEGRLQDFDPEFVDKHCQIDYVKGVHYGVVRAVGECFDEYGLEHGLWYVQKTGYSQLKTDASSMPMSNTKRDGCGARDR